MPVIQSKTTYLEMLHPLAERLGAPRNDIQVTRVPQPSIERYLGWYRLVGSQLSWVDRHVMPEEELRKILHDDRVEIFLLEVAGDSAGYVEFDCRVPDEIELAYFGLFPPFIGKGLGRYFLNWALHQAWSHRPTRVWVHTCDLDHPAALPNYVKAGFHVFDERIIDQLVPS